VNIGIFIPNWIGDAAMCTPTLRALRRHYGADTRMVGIMRPYVAEVLAGTRLLDGQIAYHTKSKTPSERIWGVLKEMKKQKFDVAVMLTNSFRSAMLAWSAGIPTRVGYVRYGRGPLLTHKLYEPQLRRKRLPFPAIDAYLQLAYALGCEVESPRLELATQPAEEAAADAVWKKLKLPMGHQVVVLNSGGAFGAAKLWPNEHFAELARRLVTEQGLAVLVACGPAEREVARTIVRLADHPRVVSLADEPVSIGLTKACIRRSRLLITTDSGPRFFAVAFNVPVISLFGPTDAAWTRTHYDHETCLSHSVPCGPCSQRVCPLKHHECMRHLSVHRVYAAALEQLVIQRESRAA